MMESKAKKNKLALEEINGKLSQILGFVSDIDQRLSDVENKLINLNAPPPPPRPHGSHDAKDKIRNTSTYEEVMLPPVVHARREGKYLTETQRGYLQQYIDEVETFVRDTNFAGRESKRQYMLGNIKNIKKNIFGS